MNSNYAIIEGIFESLGLIGAEVEVIESFSIIKTWLEKGNIHDIALAVKGIEGSFGCKFPRHNSKLTKEKYVLQIMEVLIYKSFLAKEDGSLLEKTNKAYEVAEKAAPGLLKKLQWYLRLFKPNKN